MTKRVKYDEQRDMIEKNITKVENKSSIQRHQSDEEMLPQATIRRIKRLKQKAFEAASKYLKQQTINPTKKCCCKQPLEASNV